MARGFETKPRSERALVELGKPVKQCLLVHTKHTRLDFRLGADADSEQQHDRERENGAAAQQPHTELHVSPQVRHRAT
jgi:hypothetical protein